MVQGQWSSGELNRLEYLLGALGSAMMNLPSDVVVAPRDTQGVAMRYRDTARALLEVGKAPYEDAGLGASIEALDRVVHAQGGVVRHDTV